MQFDIRTISDALNITLRGGKWKAKNGDWPYTETTVRGGRKRLYNLADLPEDVQAKVTLYLAKTGQLETKSPEPQEAVQSTPVETEPREWTHADSNALWEWAGTCTQKKRDKGADRARIMMLLDELVSQDTGVHKAAGLIAKSEGVGKSSVLRWWYEGGNNKQPIINFPKSDWPALLIPGHTGCTVRKEIDPRAWDFFVAHHLNRRQPTLSDSYERTVEAAQANGWGKQPSRATFERRLEEVPLAQRTYLREGAEALARMFPPQRRDKSMLTAGEIVNGDGLKFDRLWIRFPDGEILNTTTGWFWQDVRTNKILAYRLAKTENTDLFRLATYDLTAICLPRMAIIDNTRVAANKVMTGRSAGRHRFKSRPDDPIGLLNMIGMPPQFTNPDKVFGSPGAKPVERAFGIGGIHEKVATHPRFLDRGYSQKTAIDFDEFQEVVAEEVARFNARPGRKTAICRGVLSYDQAFEESFSNAEVRQLSEAQRNLLLLMPEVARCKKRSGEIELKAGSGPWGKHRYWDEALMSFCGEQVMVFYDPENLTKDVSVHRMDGRFITTAEHKSDIPVITTTDSREYHKHKARFVKSNRKAATAQRRMDDIANHYPNPDEVSIPEPGILRPNFGMNHSVVDGVVAGRKVANGPDLPDDPGTTQDEFNMLDYMKHWPQKTEDDY